MPNYQSKRVQKLQKEALGFRAAARRAKDAKVKADLKKKAEAKEREADKAEEGAR